MPRTSQYSLADTSDTADRAFGLAASGTGGIHSIGAEFINSTGGTLNKFTITFDMEEWREEASATNTMTFGYAVGGTDLRTGTFTGASALEHGGQGPGDRR